MKSGTKKEEVREKKVKENNGIAEKLALERKRPLIAESEILR